MRIESSFAVCLPLLARGKVFGALVFVSSHPSRRYRPRDLRLAQELVHRAARRSVYGILRSKRVR